MEMKEKLYPTLPSERENPSAPAIEMEVIDDGVTKISDDEFKLIMEKLNKYKAMKEEIRNNTKKRITEEEERSLIERGRQEARESFRKLVEKSKTGI